MCGRHNKLIEKRFLSEPELTLTKATEIALAMGAAAKDTLKLQCSKESEVNKISNGNDTVPNVNPKPRDHCYRCGDTTRQSSEFHFKNETCRKCGKLGHMQMHRVCRSGKGQNSTRQRKDEKPNLHFFEMDDERSNNSLVGYVIWVTPKINGHILKMELDTGSAISTLPLQM